MKVGTDGVLLGAWCPLPLTATPSPLHPTHHNDTPYTVLDIGTGSGLIALMLAQRLLPTIPRLTIDAIDLDADAVSQANYNFEQSPWAKHLHAHQTSLQDWQSQTKYNLIVSNPPYFQASLKNPDNQRATARHTDTLSYRELIVNSARLLHTNGTLALVLPIESKDEILALAQENGLYPTHTTHVHSKPGKPAKRLLIALSAHRLIASSPTTFYIESENAPRSEEYKRLTETFYL